MSVPPASPSPSPLALSTIVTRLRAAGCVFAEDEARLIVSTARTPADLAAMVDRRAAGLPLEHVLGWAEFCGLRVAVDPGVFVPRRRTEFLVRQAVAALTGRGRGRGAVVVDLCCGSGAVGTVLGGAVLGGTVPVGAGPVGTGGRPAEVHAVDVDPAAVRCARRNLAPVGGLVYEGDLYEPLPAALRGRVDVLVANVPYVPTEEVGLLPPEARLYESLVALDGGTDGLDVLRRVAVGAPGWLAPGGCLLVETSERQVSRAVETVAQGGLAPRVAVSEELNATVIIGHRTSPRPPVTLPRRAPSER